MYEFDSRHVVVALGDIFAIDGTATGGNFAGQCNNCRPPGAEQTVGNLDDGKPLKSNVTAQNPFVDGVIQLIGSNSIIGRSIVIRGNVKSSSVRVCSLSTYVCNKSLMRYGVLCWSSC